MVSKLSDILNVIINVFDPAAKGRKERFNHLATLRSPRHIRLLYRSGSARGLLLNGTSACVLFIINSMIRARVDKHPQKGTSCDRVVLKAQHLVLSCEDLQAHAANCKPIPRIKSKDSLTLITDVICRVFLEKSLTSCHPFKFIAAPHHH